MEINEEDYLAHYGVARRSGRYPWGSGDNVTVTPPRNMSFLDQVSWLKGQGLSESMIAKGFDMSINQLRAQKSIESNALRQANINMAVRLRDTGNSPSAIAARMGAPESTVRSWLEPDAKDRADILTNTVNMLKSQMEKKELLDVGKGTENFIGVSKTKLDTALEVLKQEGYSVFQLKDPQATTSHETKIRVLAPPGVPWVYVQNNKDKIQLITDFSDDGGRHFGSLQEPIAINPKRIAVTYGPDGGSKADGMIYIRPGIDDISIGGSKYAQVRVAVGKDHYLKGMAVYKNDLPPGVDIVFNTNKKDTGNKLDAMKKNANEPGYIKGGEHVILKSVKRQILADPGTDKERVTSAMNIVNEEGNWEKWSHELSSQMLSKQQPILAKSQLEMTYERRLYQLEEINKLTNATVRKKMLMDFADATDSAAVHLHAAALPNTAQHVILPISSMPKNQIYAPGYKNGEKVVLIRHPHGGTFEIPELIVNNKQPEAKRLLGDARDAVGIHHSVAKWLSGADFDGDTVLVIPNNQERIRHGHALDDLKDFDPVHAYPGYPGMKKMTNTQREMGEISNLITDMSLKNAPHSDIARAVKHSMVVIDAEKHGLDYKGSYNDNGITQLKKKYQTGGASTLISRAKADTPVPRFKPRTRPLGGPINLKTGELEFEPTNQTHYKTGKLLTQRVPRLSVTRDAHTIKSTPTGTPMENIYADHSNKLKGLANKARLTAVKTPPPKINPSAKKTYKTEVDSLNAQLDLAHRNRPLERQAQRIADANVKLRKQADPTMDDEQIKKISYQALVQARLRTGAEKQRIQITNKEWEAIQAGAISDSKLQDILNNADMDIVRDHATPKTPVLMTSAKTARAKQMLALGYDRADIAAQLGVSLSTLDNATV